MRLLVEYTSHGRGPAAPQTYTATLDIVDDVAERLLKAKTPYTFRERKRCTREALILASGGIAGAEGGPHREVCSAHGYMGNRGRRPATCPSSSPDVR